MPKLVFVNEKREIEVPAGANMRDEARKAGIDLYPGMARYFNCFGHGQCGTCKVLVKSGAESLSPKSAIERFTLWRMLSSIGHESEMRLSCQCKINGDCTVQTQPDMNLCGDNFWQKPYPNK